MRPRLIPRFAIVLIVAQIMALIAGPARAMEDCLGDDDLRIVVRSVYTRSIGRVMRACAMQHPSLDEHARDAATGFLTTYAEQMRANRLAANSIMMRVYGEGWEAKFEKMLLDTTAADEAWARAASKEDCEAGINRLDAMIDANDYAKVMAGGAPQRVYEAGRSLIPRCEP